MKKLVVACNAGVATSNTIAYKVKSLLKKKGYEAQVEAVDITSVERALKTADMYICIIKPDKDYGVPMCNGMAFLTGVGVEKELEKIIEVLKK